MDKLNLGLGGHPFTADDLMFMQDAYLEGIKGSLEWMRALTADDLVIIRGCVITAAGTSYTYTDGYVWMDGEIYYVPAQATPQPWGGVGTDFYVLAVENNDPLGTVPYENATIQNTWKRRTAVINQLSGFQYTSNIKYGDLLAAVLTPINAFIPMATLSTLALKSVDPWHVVGAAGEPALGANFSVSSAGCAIRFRKTDVGTVCIMAQFVVNASGINLFTMPASHLPTSYTEPSSLSVPLAGTLDARVEIGLISGQVLVYVPGGGSLPVGQYTFAVNYML